MKLTGDMTTGNPGKKLFLFAVPMVLGNVFQQFYTIVDSIIVGKYVGSDALAAVGASTSITFLFIAIATGASIGSSVVISQYFGAAQYTKMKTAISTVLISIFLLSSVLMAVGLITNNTILRLIKTPDNIFGDASVYLKIYFTGIVFLFVYNTLTAVFNALGQSYIPLVFLIISSIINIGLDLLFVLRFDMGVSGVAYATLIAQGVCACISFVVLLIRLRRLKIKEKAKLFDFSILKNIFRVAVPSTIQQSIVSIGSILVQTLVNGYGSIVMAGYTAATRIDSIAIMPMVNVGSALSTFTAQNMGAKKMERIPKGLKAAWLMVLFMAILITGSIFLFGDTFIGIFVDKTTGSEVIDVGVNYLKVVSLFYIVFGSMNLLNGILRGSGDMKVFMACTLCNLGTRVFLAYGLSFLLGASSVWWAIPIGWGVGLSIALFRYCSGKWKEKSLIK